MPRCIDCANFQIQNKYCSWYNAYIGEQLANERRQCDGFKLAEKHHRIPDMKLVRVK